MKRTVSVVLVVLMVGVLMIGSLGCGGDNEGIWSKRYEKLINGKDLEIGIKLLEGYDVSENPDYLNWEFSPTMDGELSEGLKSEFWYGFNFVDGKYNKSTDKGFTEYVATDLASLGVMIEEGESIEFIDINSREAVLIMNDSANDFGEAQYDIFGYVCYIILEEMDIVLSFGTFGHPNPENDKETVMSIIKSIRINII